VSAAPRVDTHFHVYTRDMPLAASAWHKPTEDATIERLVATLDAHGVRYGVLAPASLYGDYNEYTREAVRRYPERLRASAIVSPDIDPAALKALRDDGFVGVRFQFRDRAEPPDLQSKAYQELLKRVADLGWIVHLHDHGARLAPAIAAIEPFGVRLVVEHFGRPTKGLGIECPGFRATLAAVERGRTWVKLSAGFRLEPPSMAQTYTVALLRVSGGERLLWGSDWPFAAFEDKVKYADTIAALHEWVPDAATRQKIASETPRALYFS
jgi:predicted TIM-barrel fold metal-dependent hydrolase